MAGVVMALVKRATSAAQPDRTMFGHAAGLTAILLIDDFFLVHDCVAAQGYDTQAKVLTLGYFVLVAAFFVRHQRTLGPTATVGIVAAVGLLGMSAALDVVANRIDQLVEDGFNSEEDLNSSWAPQSCGTRATCSLETSFTISLTR